MSETIATFGPFKVIELPSCFHVEIGTTGSHWVEHSREEAEHLAEWAEKHFEGKTA